MQAQVANEASEALAERISGLYYSSLDVRHDPDQAQALLSEIYALRGTPQLESSSEGTYIEWHNALENCERALGIGNWPPLPPDDED